MGHDLLAFGEGLLRLQPEIEGGRIEDAARFCAHPGGAELNTCHAVASLGLSAAWFSVVPDGPLGRRVVRHARAAGVDTSLVKSRPGRLGSYWVEYGREPRTIEVLYDRKDSSVCHVQREDVPWDALRTARCFLVTGITPALSPAACAVSLEMAEVARAAGVVVATDLNYRARLWPAAEAAPVLERLARLAQVVITTEDDLRTLFGMGGEPEALARDARARFGCRVLALTRGGEGAVSLDGDAVNRCPVFPGTRLDRIGAGDAFTAGFLFALLTGRDAQALELGLALAALKHTVPGDTIATTREELEHTLRREGRDIRR